MDGTVMTPRWLRRITIAGVLALTVAVGTGATPVTAHDDIRSSTPTSRSTLSEPISTVEIDFGEVISDDVAMFLVYDLGDNEFEDIGGETVRTGETTARLDFDEVEREGTYFVQYLAPVPVDGHVIAGAISFTYGSPSTGGSGGFPVVPFIVGALIVLVIGGWFTYRRMLVPVDESNAAAT
ncbi:MAG: copper resistance protein CopC [Ilumatobacter sp.]|nr:copper resistance protein CopC [Ilumatobacter sp.]MDG2040085.1 copper resistance protein CopC [Ilumatobacter sp.]